MTVVPGRHKLDYRRIGLVPIVYLLVLTVIVVNEAVLSVFGPNDIEYLFSRGHGNGNGGPVFGTYPGTSKTIVKLLTVFVPYPFKPDSAGNRACRPVLWRVFSRIHMRLFRGLPHVAV